MSPKNDSAFLRMFLFVLGALVAFTVIIMFIAGSVTDEPDKKQAGDSRLQSEIAKRIAPVGEVAVTVADTGTPSVAAEVAPVVEEAVEVVEQAAGDVADAANGMMESAMGAVSGAAEAMMPQSAAPAPAPAPAAAADLANGKTVYDGACFVCHATGAAGAPLLGNKEQWAPRVAQGMEALYNAGVNGKLPAMPPKGGRTDLSDQAVMDAVAYMVDQAK